MSVRRKRPRALDLLYCVLTALVIIAVMMATGFEWGADVIIKWDGLAGYSALLFWALLAGEREQKRTAAFWGFVFLFALAHTAGWVLLLRAIPEWKILWFCVVFAEVPVFEAAYGVLFVMPGSGESV
ncbi:MAG TPA: hypothetical protein VNF74_05480 [Terriglobales bacterium]|nr:hypothetical protein [Terriglobales bacterium]